MAFQTVFVDTTILLEECLSALSSQPEIAVDLEGVNLCREGRVALVQMIARSSSTVWIIDITTLGATAFDYTASSGRSLKGLLEDSGIMKAFYDVRSDADALYNLYGIDLKNVYDVQLLEVAYRRSTNQRNVRFLHGLGKSVDYYLTTSSRWKTVKEAGLKLFAPEHGGSYDVFESRPINATLVEYSAQDVTIMFDLVNELQRRIGNAYRSRDWDRRIRVASSDRASLAKSPVCQGGRVKDRTRAYAPIL